MYSIKTLWENNMRVVWAITNVMVFDQKRYKEVLCADIELSSCSSSFWAEKCTEILFADIELSSCSGRGGMCMDKYSKWGK